MRAKQLRLARIQVPIVVGIYVLMNTITSAKSTSDSINARPRIIIVWIFAAAPGFRAAPSQAAAPIRDWPMAPPNTAIANPIPAAIALVPTAEAAAAAASP